MFLKYISISAPSSKPIYIALYSFLRVSLIHTDFITFLLVTLNNFEYIFLVVSLKLYFSLSTDRNKYTDLSYVMKSIIKRSSKTVPELFFFKILIFSFNNNKLFNKRFKNGLNIGFY